MRKHLEYIIPIALITFSLVLLILTKDISTVKLFGKVRNITDVLDIFIIAPFFAGFVFLICAAFGWFEGLDSWSFFLGRTVGRK